MTRGTLKHKNLRASFRRAIDSDVFYQLPNPHDFMIKEWAVV
jgi:hypothetical protein